MMFFYWILEIHLYEGVFFTFSNSLKKKENKERKQLRQSENFFNFNKSNCWKCVSCYFSCYLIMLFFAHFVYITFKILETSGFNELFLNIK